MRFGMRALRYLGVIILVAASTAAAAGDEAPVASAAKRRDASAVRALLKQKANVNAALPDGATALHWAAYWDDAELVDVLLQAGAKVNTLNDYGVSPLWLVASNGGRATTAERLLKAGADPNVALPGGETVLMTAAHAGKADLVKVLLDRGAAIDAREASMGQTALMWAISESHGDVIRLLVERGADVKATSASGFTPFLFTARMGDIETAKFLLSKGVDLKQAMKDGTTALHISVIRGHLPYARFLLDLGFDPNSAGPGYTVLHWASGIWESVFTQAYVFSPQAATTEFEWAVLGGLPSREEKMDFIKTLLAKGADVNAKLTRSPPRYGASVFPGNYLTGGTPFHIATAVADVPVMRLLLSLGADPKLGANDQTTPLIVAAGMARVDSETMIPESRLIEAMKICIELGHDVNAANNAGNTAMHAAALQGLDQVVQFLHDHGANVNPKNKKGETPTKIADGYESASMLYTRPSTAALLRKLGGKAE